MLKQRLTDNGCVKYSIEAL